MSDAAPRIDISRKFVRLIERRPDGLVEFEFAIGEPELFVEMLLPEPAYHDFCRINAVEALPPRVSTPDDPAASDWDWRLHQATSQRFK